VEAKAKTPGEVLKTLKAGRFITLAQRLPHGGSLQGRRLADAIQLYWRYSHEGKTHRQTVGLYDSSAPPRRLTPTVRGYSIQAAIEACKALAATHAARATTGGLREAKADEMREHLARKAAETERGARTLEVLLQTYVAFLAAQGRQSAREVQNLFRLNVVKAWPKISAKPAADVTPEDVLDILRKLMEAGKGRSANKLRSYLRAAYQCAIDVRTTASVPVAFKAFQVTSNPAALTKRSAQFDRADKRPLPLVDLRRYWRLIEDMPGLPGAALRVHLMSGGQRIEQILRLRRQDITEDSLTIFDTKGRPGGAPRSHLLPLTDVLRQALEHAEAAGTYVFSASGGKTPLVSTTLAKWARQAVGDVVPGFLLKRVRSGVETTLAAAGVSKEVRGHLQSHGLTGVQARHYDGHDYVPQKLEALNLLHTLLDDAEAGKAERRAT
jgi:integrase